MFCYETISQFDFTGVPKINNVYNFSCINGNYDVVVDAVGLAPLHFRITSKDGAPFLLQNGTSSLFLGLAAGTYNFQVEDACGYILNSLYSVPIPFTFGITPTNFCNGQLGSLTVPNFSFLTYQWWKDTNPTIISTSNSLQFPSFTSTLNSGIYHVRVLYTGNPNSCINFVLNYTIAPNSTNPNAGIGSNVTHCGANGIMNLFSLLSGTFDTTGTWQELTNSGTLVNNLWNSNPVSPGLYVFKYRVNGSCNTFDEEQVYVTIKAVPATPIATADPALCESQNIQLHASTIPNVAYNWTGPNGFTATVQNPLISNATIVNSGTYQVKCTLNGCDSGTSNITVILHPTPLFSLDSECITKRYTIWATPLTNSYDATTATYSWTEPNGNSSSQHPLDSTNHPSGTYSLTITTTAGCSTTVTKEISSTLCEVPSGLSPNGDGNNEILDLTGLGEVEKFKIYNRYGMVVFEQDGYTSQWHGQDYNDNILPGGTYYYYVKLKSTNEPRTGWIYLVVE
jgi:gliding motility-associated-like protein